MNKKVLITGASGKIGRVVAESVIEYGKFDVRLFLGKSAESKLAATRFTAAYGQNAEILSGDVSNFSDCLTAVDGVDYVLHFAAVIPPSSNHNPEAAERVNYFGTKNLIDAVKESGRGAEVKFVYAAPSSEYGNRDFHHPWARVGDPLIPSLFDVYSITKLRAEKYVVASGLKNWVCFRTAPVLYDGLSKDFIDDGLMLQTPLNAPVELITLKDVARLYKNLVVRDEENALPPEFWRKIYDVGGGADSRMTGYELYGKLLALLNGKTEKILEPHWLPTRNGTSCWLSDGDVCDGYLDYRREDAADFFASQNLLHAYLKAARHLSPVIKKLLFQRMVNSPDSPYYWVDNGMTDRVAAFFGSYDAWGKIPRRWDKVPLLVNGSVTAIDGKVYDVDYTTIKKHESAAKMALNHGYDENKNDAFLCFDDFQAAALYRGGKCLSTEVKRGDLHTPLKWQCADGHVFKATAYGVLKGGYWCPDCCSPAPWNFDAAAKKSPFFAQIWYDTHDEEENVKLAADCYRDIPREDARDAVFTTKDKIKKFRKG